MGNFEERDYNVFQLFKRNWGIVTAGNIENYNEMTISWGNLGTIWTRPGKSSHVVTVYAYPTRYTCEYLKDNDYFTVSFFPKENRKELAYIGSHSGRDGDKIAATGLTPIALGKCVDYKEATLTFYCKKIYQGQLSKDGMAEEIKEYYAENPSVYLLDENGDWNPHWMFMGEIISVEDRR